jgi:hypothetical protein
MKGAQNKTRRLDFIFEAARGIWHTWLHSGNLNETTELVMTGNDWIPTVDCKTPICLHGKPTFIPYQGQPNWPWDTWKAFIVCRHCGQGHQYMANDVRWGQAPNLGIWEQNFFFSIELKCDQEECKS